MTSATATSHPTHIHTHIHIPYLYMHLSSYNLMLCSNSLFATILRYIIYTCGFCSIRISRSRVPHGRPRVFPYRSPLIKSYKWE